MSSLWTDLLFLHGHIANADLARRLADKPAPAPKPRDRRSRLGFGSSASKSAQPRGNVSPCGQTCSPT
ncbi:hypothetical protein RKE25_03335 [Dyella sp. BiH032]|uniref:hypothetical protein n=1 Tax=Dyella sp. BiH032 TaxID=3075430 RepID=UPI0028930FF0|nr:hypothetical protein [Dyella sp. BiH032]WNL46685.1 hypothetical protein RKE25_03335 [Dyella sp. BiH032]